MPKQELTNPKQVWRVVCQVIPSLVFLVKNAGLGRLMSRELIWFFFIFHFFHSSGLLRSHHVVNKATGKWGVNTQCALVTTEYLKRCTFTVCTWTTYWEVSWGVCKEMGQAECAMLWSGCFSAEVAAVCGYMDSLDRGLPASKKSASLPQSLMLFSLSYAYHPKVNCKSSFSLMLSLWLLES